MRIPQIFSSCDPLSLLHLSRTQRGLRRMLMAVSLRSTWTASLATLDGLPPCPDWLNEAQYASLLFDSHCHRCGGYAGVNRAIVEFNARYCDDCLPLQCVLYFLCPRRSLIHSTCSLGSLRQIRSMICPTVAISACSFRIWYCQQSIVRYFIQLSRCPPRSLVAVSPQGKPGGICYHVPDVLRFVTDIGCADSFMGQVLVMLEYRTITAQVKTVNSLWNAHAACLVSKIELS